MNRFHGRYFAKSGSLLCSMSRLSISNSPVRYIHPLLASRVWIRSLDPLFALAKTGQQKGHLSNPLLIDGGNTFHARQQHVIETQSQ
jgi:hypothetical protein